MMGKSSLPVVGREVSPATERRRWGLKLAGILALALIPINLRFNLGILPHYARAATSTYGQFPDPLDSLQFIPCTNTTIVPALEDADPARSWARLFDPNPDNWSWGHRRGDGAAHPNDKYSGRGIYMCGFLDVPLDYTNQSETRVVRLAVTKFQVSGLARSDSHSRADDYTDSRPGSKSNRTIVIEPGGPGGSGTAYAWRFAENVTERLSGGQFDVLGWDPRGINASRPAVACYPSSAPRERWSQLAGQYREVSTSPGRQLEIADSMNEALFRACWERHGDFGRFVSTAFVSRDLEEIRKALREDEVTGYFVSYGTGIAQTYANIFPNRVGRMILDGTEFVKDHRLLGGFGWTALDNVTDAWHDGFLGECIKAGPEHCALAQSKTGEVVTLEALESRMNTLLRSIIRRPMPAYRESSGPSLITYSTLVKVIYMALYNVELWPSVAEMLYDLERGNSTLAAKMLDTWGWDPASMRPPSSNVDGDELGALVICSDAYDAPQPADGLDWWEVLWANMTSTSWIAGNSRFFDVFPCRHFATHWPEPAEVYRGDLNKTLKNPVLLIAETYDPATPLRNGKRLLHEMGANARLIAHHAYGHSSSDKSACTDKIAKNYILHGNLPRDQETSCYADQRPYRANIVAAEGGLRLEADPAVQWKNQVQVPAFPYLDSYNEGTRPDLG
ncbi:Alpha/Beta hydrolase protein [Astrocystis sublimbata]|nr:Alpha/Beta hydrolase protein [Astrocystis sublimbata]